MEEVLKIGEDLVFKVGDYVQVKQGIRGYLVSTNWSSGIPDGWVGKIHEVYNGGTECDKFFTAITVMPEDRRNNLFYLFIPRQFEVMKSVPSEIANAELIPIPQLRMDQDDDVEVHRIGLSKYWHDRLSQLCYCGNKGEIIITDRGPRRHKNCLVLCEACATKLYKEFGNVLEELKKSKE